MNICMCEDIVLIPGALATPKQWKTLENYLSGRFRLHYVDVLDSQSILEMASRFAEKAPDKFTLIGFSMGGYVALELAHHIPQQLEKLILINTAAKTVSVKGQAERERSLDLIQKGKFDLLVSLIFKNSIHDQSKHSSLLPIAQNMAHEVGAENYKHQLHAILNKPDHSALLPMIECPTLIIASQDDRIMPNKHSKDMAENIQNSELIYLENCGHLATLEQPEKINQIVSGWL